MTEQNFFDRWWKPYLEYVSSVSFGEIQPEEEIKELKIERGDDVINIGINWGASINFIFKVFPEVGRVYGADSSKMMLSLSNAVFSEDNSQLSAFLSQLKPHARTYLKNLHREARDDKRKPILVYSSAEELYKQGIAVDKIAATMGFHWLSDPKEDGFISMNRSLKDNGVLTFSTASAFYQVNDPACNFLLNPYYSEFLKMFEKEFLKEFTKSEQVVISEKTHKYSLDEILGVVERSGFVMEQAKELKMELGDADIRKACLGAIRFRYGIDIDDDVKVSRIALEALAYVDRKFRYGDSPARFEICPIFKIRKTRDV